MKALTTRWAVLTIAVFLTSEVVESLDVGGVLDHVLFAVAIGLVNALIRPVVRLLALPLRVATFGLASLVIDGVLFLVTAAVTDRATIGGVFSAIVAAMVLSIISAVLNALVVDRRPSVTR